MAITFADISRMSLFRGFSQDFVRLLDVFFTEKNYPKETLIIEQGKLQSVFYVIISGEVEIYESLENEKIILNTLAAGHFFGEINLLDPGVALASVASLTPVKTLEISNEQFRKFISQKPELAADFTFQLAEILAKRFRQSNDIIQKELTKPRAIQLGKEISLKQMQA
jgi:CRP/FNR family transcriptional regulator, cyclic AMP receptor protein